MNSTAVRWALAWLRWFCPEQLYEEIEGDLIQRFRRDVALWGPRRSQVRLVWNVIRFLRPGIVLRKRVLQRPGYLMMTGNYLITSYRHVLRHRVSSLFKLTGLTLAMYSFLVIVLYVVFQLSVDRYHHNYESVYRVNSERRENGVQIKYAITPRALGPMLQAILPDVETYARMSGFNQRHIRYHNDVFTGQILQVDSSFFDVFSFQFIAGDRRALTRPRSIVLTRKLAGKIFGTEDPLHKTVTLTNGELLYEVTAVIEDMPAQSHLTGEAFVPMEADGAGLTQASVVSPVEFVDNSASLYIRFAPGTGRADLAAKLESVMDKILPVPDRKASGFALSIQPLKDIYLDEPLKYEFTRKGSMMYLLLFVALAGFLLLVASVNYINLSMADFAGRLREIGIRKIMGAGKMQIAFQVVLEGVLYCLCSLLLAAAALYVSFPQVIQLVEPELRFGMLFHREVIVTVLLVVSLLVLGATVVPSWRIARGTSAGDLKAARGGQGPAFSQVLLVIQSFVSILCIGATLVMGRQLHFIHDKDLGFDRKNLLMLLMPENFSVQQMQVLKRELQSIPGVDRVSNSSFKIGGWYWKDWYNVEVDGQMKSMELYEVFSDDDMFETLGLKLKAGRTFSAGYPADSGAAFVINETAARQLGWEDPVGKRINTHPEKSGRWEGTVVGVVGDIHISPLYDQVQPLVMRLPWQADYPEFFVYVRINGPEREVMDAIAHRYKTLMPGYPLEIDQVDSYYNSRYPREDRAFASLQAGSLMVMLIASLGIFSLSMYMSVRRMKEFGIRKVLGASVGQISFLQIAQFLKIVAVANIIALPMTEGLMRAWLGRFAYHTTVPLWIFLIVAVLSVLLVMLSAGYASWRSGRLNPVDVIRNQS